MTGLTGTLGRRFLLTGNWEKQKKLTENWEMDFSIIGMGSWEKQFNWDGKLGMSFYGMGRWDNLPMRWERGLRCWKMSQGVVKRKIYVILLGK